MLRNQWSTGLDYNPNNAHLSDWLKMLFQGDYERTVKALGDLSKEQASKLLERRETLLNVSAIFHVVVGARILCAPNPVYDFFQKHVENKNGHIKILAKLLEMEPCLKAKDMCGYTPLHHCLTSYANSTTLVMAGMILKAGADPNLQNRFGSSPIFECIAAANLKAIQLLLKYGARTDVKEFDSGLTPQHMARYFPKVLALFSKAGLKVDC